MRCLCLILLLPSSQDQPAKQKQSVLCSVQQEDRKDVEVRRSYNAMPLSDPAAAITSASACKPQLHGYFHMIVGVGNPCQVEPQARINDTVQYLFLILLLP